MLILVLCTRHIRRHIHVVTLTELLASLNWGRLHLPVIYLWLLLLRIVGKIKLRLHGLVRIVHFLMELVGNGLMV